MKNIKNLVLGILVGFGSVLFPLIMTLLTTLK